MREKFRVKRDLEANKKKKVKFLEQKYGKIKVKQVPDEIEGINVADKEIPTSFTSNAMEALPLVSKNKRF